MIASHSITIAVFELFVARLFLNTDRFVLDLVEQVHPRCWRPDPAASVQLVRSDVDWFVIK